MAIVKRANVELRVPENCVKEYLEMGYSEIDSNGKTIQKCKPQTLEDYKLYAQDLLTQLGELQKANKELSAQLTELQITNKNTKTK